MTLEQKFTEKWPEFFRDIQCGFYLPDEWEADVWRMCNELQEVLEGGGYPLSSLQVAQVKEKFGGLRFYYDLSEDVDKGTREALSECVREAEDRIPMGPRRRA